MAVLEPQSILNSGGHLLGSWPHRELWFNFGSVMNPPAMSSLIGTFALTHAMLTICSFKKGRSNVRNHDQPQKFTDTYARAFRGRSRGFLSRSNGWASPPYTRATGWARRDEAGWSLTLAHQMSPLIPKGPCRSLTSASSDHNVFHHRAAYTSELRTPKTTKNRKNCTLIS